MNSVTVVDLETTGLYAASGDKITEIGAIKLKGNKICGIFNTLVNPERLIPEFSTKLTGITNEMVSSSPTISRVLPLFVQFAGEDTLVMHNSDFDGGFIKHELALNNIDKTYEYYCTLKASRQLVKSSNFRLSTLKNILNLKTYGSMHRALSDTYVTAQLFLKLQKNYGIDTMDTMEKSLQKLLSQMEEDDVFVMDENCS